MSNQRDHTRDRRVAARVRDDASDTIDRIRAELRRRNFRESDGQAIEYLAAFAEMASSKFDITAEKLVDAVLDHSGRIK